MREELEYEAMLKSFFNKADIGICVTDFETCEILFVNKKMLSKLGRIDSSEIVGLSCWVNQTPFSKVRCQLCTYSALNRPAQNFTWEKQLEIHGIWLKILNQIIEWTDGRLANLSIVFDITESKQENTPFCNSIRITDIFPPEQESCESKKRTSPITRRYRQRELAEK